MRKKSKSEKRAKAVRKGPKKPAAPEAKKVVPEQEPAAPDVDLSVVVEGRDAQLLLDALARQNELLEVVAMSVARVMMITDHENRLAGEARAVPDPHGLRRDVEKLLTRGAMNKTLLPDDDPNSEEGSDDD